MRFLPTRSLRSQKSCNYESGCSRSVLEIRKVSSLRFLETKEQQQIACIPCRGADIRRMACFREGVASSSPVHPFSPLATWAATLSPKG